MSILDLDNIELTEHGFDRSKLRFKLNNKKEALNYWKGILPNATMIGEQMSETGNPSILFAYNRMAIYMSLDLKYIVTVNHYESVTYDPIKETVKEIHAKEFRKLKRKEKYLMKQNIARKLELNKELAEIELREFKTRSETVRDLCQQRKTDINNEMLQMDFELKQVRDSIRQVAKSMVAVS